MITEEDQKWAAGVLATNDPVIGFYRPKKKRRTRQQYHMFLQDGEQISIVGTPNFRVETMAIMVRHEVKTAMFSLIEIHCRLPKGLQVRHRKDGTKKWIKDGGWLIIDFDGQICFGFGDEPERRTESIDPEKLFLESK